MVIPAALVLSLLLTRHVFRNARIGAERKLIRNRLEIPQKRICAWCGKVLQDGNVPATHGICTDCKGKVEENGKDELEGGADHRADAADSYVR